MPRLPTALLLTLCAVASSSCASPPPPAPPPEVPDALLRCAPAPAVPAVDAPDWDRRLMEYVAELWAAGDDCRTRLEQVRDILAPLGAASKARS